jgi:1-acyl-sn-glycerol-3-phosphate acyltransferase
LKPTLLPTRVFRLARLALHVVLGLVVAWLAFARASPARQDRILRWWGRGVLRALRVTPLVRGAAPGLQAPVLLVANHVSWLDIFAIHAVKPVRFVAKADIHSWPVLGWLCARTGTLFIERDRARHALHVIHAMRARLTAGFSIGIFPEGTSSAGDYVRAFHAALFQAVPGQGAMVPVALRYLDALGEPTKAAAYAGEVTLVECLRNILGQPKLFVELNFEEPLDVSGRSRRELADAAEAVIASRLGVPVLRETEGSRSPQPETEGLAVMNSSPEIPADPPA